MRGAWLLRRIQSPSEHESGTFSTVSDESLLVFRLLMVSILTGQLSADQAAGFLYGYPKCDAMCGITYRTSQGSTQKKGGHQ